MPVEQLSKHVVTHNPGDPRGCKAAAKWMVIAASRQHVIKVISQALNGHKALSDREYLKYTPVTLRKG